MKVRRKIIGAVLAASIAIGTAPLTELPVKAAGGAETPTPKTIMAGVSVIEGAQKSNIYYGNYQQENAGENEPTGSDRQYRQISTANQNQ